MLNGIIEIDVHGKNVESAIEEIRKYLNNAKPSVYRIRIIHGYHGGTGIRDGIREEFSYGREHIRKYSFAFFFPWGKRRGLA
mgnify:CR=1 FL=1